MYDPDRPPFDPINTDYSCGEQLENPSQEFKAGFLVWILTAALLAIGGSAWIMYISRQGG
jgi:hypothetical protein